MTWSIQAEGLSKRYRVGALRSGSALFSERIAHLARHPVATFRSILRPSKTFWALKDVTFATQPGDILGVVGRNGAGKSTLLKLLSRITEPSQGRARLRGRLASLLEVGTGFHPELSGRENIHLNATILGMRSQEIRQRFDEIVSFAGIERFLETPVKRYSSGMYMRLAFAIAAHVEADILLVDEVLAVGDAEFQKRCMGKMDQVARGGRTVLFVSHNATALRNLCTRGLLLEGGTTRLVGTINEVLDAYSGTGPAMSTAIALQPGEANQPEAAIRQVTVKPLENGTDVLRVEAPFVIEVLLTTLVDDADLAPFIHCHSDEGSMVFSSGSFFERTLTGARLAAGDHYFRCHVPGPLLNDGNYTLDVFIVRDRSQVIATHRSLLTFRVQDTSSGPDGWNWRPVGVVRPQLQWHYARAPEREE